MSINAKDLNAKDFNAKDLRVGLLFVAIGAFFGIYGYATTAIGTPARMGPGFFPVILSGVLAALGALIIIGAFAGGRSARVAVPWRALALVLLAPMVFGLALRGFGFIVAVFATVTVSALASPRMGIVHALMLAAGLTVLCVGIFSYGLGVPVVLVGPWLTPWLGG